MSQIDAGTKLQVLARGPSSGKQLLYVQAGMNSSRTSTACTGKRDYNTNRLYKLSTSGRKGTSGLTPCPFGNIEKVVAIGVGGMAGMEIVLTGWEFIRYSERFKYPSGHG